ncbi:MAG TPA: alpha-amylase [Terriglobales bacterium]|nr:alpha-amylase [Terriglobales bacterium]
MRWQSHPVIYEINTVVWLRDLGHRFGRPVTLGDVPAEAWDEVALPGVDVVWLMGVWERSPAGLSIAQANEELRRSWREALPDVRPEDVVGSPYCVRGYVVDASLGGPGGLVAAREELARRGVRLLLDYVPNHVAPDNPWVREHPEYFVRGDAVDLERDPSAFIQVDGSVLALGRDPYFPPWPDVVQLNAFAPQLRDATADVLAEIGSQCDGVRCDMAMLLMNDIFARTWGERAGSPPPQDFWPQVLGSVRSRQPDMLFVAEAYWDMEWALQQQGFDFCYDKRLYDRILHESARDVRGHLQADIAYQRKLLRFLENHDEPRAAATMPRDKECAAAVAIATLPGATLWHEGQFEGRRVRPPVFLARRPDEPLDGELRDFYGRLIEAVHASGMRDGEWRLLDSTGWPDNATSENLLAWSWWGPERHVVVVNLSDQPAQARIQLPWDDLRDRRWRLSELTVDVTFDRDGGELADAGLFVALDGWRWHLISVVEAPVPVGAGQPVGGSGSRISEATSFARRS